MIKRKNSLKKTFNDLSFIKELVSWSKEYSLPGFGGVPVYKIISFIIEETKQDNLNTRANSIAFSLFISIFPAIIFIFTLLPLISVVQDYTSMLKVQLRGVLPQTAHEYIFSIVNDIVSIQRGGLLSLGALLALLFSSNGMLTLMNGFDKAYNNTFKPRNYLNKRAIALFLTIVLSLLLVASLVLMVLENNFYNFIQTNYNVPTYFFFFFKLVNWIAAIFMVYTGITIIYTYGPSMYRKITFFNVGSILATILSLLTSLGFSFFINNFGRYNEIYGSIGALIVIMLWIQLNSFILLLGFELNASVAVNKDLTKKPDRIKK